MDIYYKILGLEPNASQQEIKRAYFKLIRKHSPESDPEQFMKIREAYEQLQQEQNADEKLTFPPLSDPFAEKMLENILQYHRVGNNDMFKKNCEEAWNMFPDDIQFLYLLVIAQRMCGNTGKSVKNAELLVQKDPDNKWYQKELAISYMERGFTQKAFFACEKAYELGCRDVDFILAYASECNSCCEYNMGMQILLELIEKDKKWSKNEMPDLIKVYFALLAMNHCTREDFFPRIIDGLCRVLEQYRIYIVDYITDFVSILEFTAPFSSNGNEIYKKVEYAFSLLFKECHTEEDRKFVNDVILEYNFQRIMRDDRIGDTMKCAYDAFNDMPHDKSEESIIVKFALLDTKLCMIEERTEILEQAEIIKKDYSDLYNKMQDFLQKLETGKNIAYLKEGMLKEYRRIEPFFGGGHYYEKYPAEKKAAMGTVIYDGMSDTPYVSNKKKVGRNDPCPCGSGKKYKHCCMNK